MPRYRALFKQVRIQVTYLKSYDYDADDPEHAERMAQGLAYAFTDPEAQSTLTVSSIKETLPF